MKKIVVLLLGLIYISSLHAQISVSGNVRNQEKLPLQGCTVWFTQADSLVGGSTTDKKGDFLLKGLPQGKYICHVSMIGFKKMEYSFSLAGNMHLPQFLLEEDATQLKEVVVTGDKRNIVQNKAGSTTFFLSERAKKASNAYEALVEIPKLLVNPISRELSLATGGKPLILINGIKRPSYIEVLDPELIESVEIIDTPSARYLGDESVTCILNIHLKRVPTPTYVNGNFFTQHAVTSWHGVSGANLELGNTSSSLYLNAQHFYFDKDKSDIYSDVQSGDILQKFSGKSTYSANSVYVNLGGDRIFSDKNYAAFAVKYIGNPSDVERDNKGTVGYQSDKRSSEASKYQLTHNKYHQATAYLYYKHTFNKQQSLEVTGNYAYSSSGSVGEQSEQNDFYQYNNLLDFSNDRHYGKLDLDYTNLINNKYTLNAGSNTSYSATNIDDLKDQFPVYPYGRWQEYLYIGFDNNRSGAKFNYALSLGIDMMFSDADHVKNHYIDFLPAVALAYTFNQKHSLKLTYSRSRFSPSAAQLNPRNTSSDSLLIQQGNPYLTPNLQENFRLSYTLNYKKFYMEPFVNYYYSSDLISAVGTMKDNIYINTYENFLCANILQTGATFRYNLPFGNINLTASYKKRYQKDLAFSGDTWSTNAFGYFYYKKLSLMLNVGYETASYGFTEKTEGIPYSNVSFAWTLPKGWQLKLMSQNFLCSNMSSKTWVKDKNYNSYSTQLTSDRSPMFLIGVSYFFKNKVENKWRQKKQFYNTDNELEGITVK